MVIDYNVGAWALDIARRTGIRSAAVWPASAAVLSTLLSYDKLIDDNIIDAEDGRRKRKNSFRELGEQIHLRGPTPAINSTAVVDPRW
jgi:hypothetical protein